MSEIYGIEDLSFVPHFAKPVRHTVFDNTEYFCVKRIESFCGIWNKWFRGMKLLEANTVYLQPSAVKEFDNYFALLPSNSVLNSIYELYVSNLGVSDRPDNRRRVDFRDEIAIDREYTLIVPSYYEDRIMYTRHPLTGVVSEHRWPFKTLPKFYSKFHPCIAVAHAEDRFGRHKLPFKLARELGKIVNTSFFPAPEMPCRIPSVVETMPRPGTEKLRDNSFRQRRMERRSLWWKYPSKLRRDIVPVSPSMKEWLRKRDLARFGTVRLIGGAQEQKREKKRASVAVVARPPWRY
ncbi:hypothetical protein CYLTODRAFT_414296 [Cylindrobasidium torrendii FP15055 ss-10]|uniref:Uncharacterized protein n=1 Tax=Cylindrobasidium torrendii FP15055 ss-10 TaxID=1314674 RepID=A0A0D7AYK6_9AGAR|nr:hypothetical protein CYLTODRAFT_414296 [Cylindrobasidium torrendii FP15055 ss-10]